jgi:hypothetical protein
MVVLDRSPLLVMVLAVAVENQEPVVAVLAQQAVPEETGHQRLLTVLPMVLVVVAALIQAQVAQEVLQGLVVRAGLVTMLPEEMLQQTEEVVVAVLVVQIQELEQAVMVVAV